MSKIDVIDILKSKENLVDPLALNNYDGTRSEEVNDSRVQQPLSQTKENGLSPPSTSQYGTGGLLTHPSQIVQMNNFNSKNVNILPKLNNGNKPIYLMFVPGPQVGQNPVQASQNSIQYVHVENDGSIRPIANPNIHTLLPHVKYQYMNVQQPQIFKNQLTHFYNGPCTNVVIEPPVLPKTPIVQIPETPDVLTHFQKMEQKLLQAAQNVQAKVSEKVKEEEENGKKPKKRSQEKEKSKYENHSATGIPIKRRKALANLWERVVLFDLDIGAEVEIRTPCYWGKKNEKKEIFDQHGNIILRERKTYTKRKAKEGKSHKVKMNKEELSSLIDSFAPRDEEWVMKEKKEKKIAVLSQSFDDEVKKWSGEAEIAEESLSAESLLNNTYYDISVI